MNYLDIKVKNLILKMCPYLWTFTKRRKTLKEFYWFFKLTHFQLFQNEFPSFDAIIPKLQKIYFGKLFGAIMTVQSVFKEFITTKDCKKKLTKKIKYIKYV